MDKHEIRELIARRVAQEFKPGTVINLGIGLPTECARYVNQDQNIILQSENGFLGLKGEIAEGELDLELTNAGGAPVGIIPGGVFLDSAECFAIVRGGHLDTTVLGALQVDMKGNLANWMIPGKLVPGMGGAMDLVVGAKNVIVAMEHTQNGRPKIMQQCSLPLTGERVVSKIITEKAVITVTPKGLRLDEVHGGATVKDVVESTDARLLISDALATRY